VVCEGTRVTPHNTRDTCATGVTDTTKDETQQTQQRHQTQGPHEGGQTADDEDNNVQRPSGRCPTASEHCEFAFAQCGNPSHFDGCSATAACAARAACGKKCHACGKTRHACGKKCHACGNTRDACGKKCHACGNTRDACGKKCDACGKKCQVSCVKCQVSSVASGVRRGGQAPASVVLSTRVGGGHASAVG